MNTTPGSEDTHDVVVSRVFEAPVEQVWKAWAESEEVQKWWGPTGFTCPVAKIDFREGGSSLVCMRAPQEFGGGDIYSTWTYTKIVPHERIEFIFNFADQAGNRLTPAEAGIPGGVPADGRHAVAFKSLGANKTEMSMIEHGYLDEETRDISKAGLEQCFDKMAASFGG